MPYSLIPAPGRTLALFVRHGRTAQNEGRPRLRAWDDMPLDRNGELDADLAGNVLKRYDPQTIYSSDLIRDTQTAERISKILGNKPTETAFELRTADMGEWTDQYSDAVAGLVRRWYECIFTEAPGGETRDAFQSRLFPWLDAKLGLLREVPQMRPAAFVTHGRIFAELDIRYNGRPPAKGRMSVPGGVAELKEMPDLAIRFEFLGPTEDVLKDA